VIAHAGQSGNVTLPQLHFEIRKGSTPVDPIKYLGGA
jgi:murein DD-endopeptidase MepM/ murein hydrolase activator NlpD